MSARMKSVVISRWPGYLAALFCLVACAAQGEWYKGVTHVHSLWSDGDMAPEMIASWYVERGYNFVCFSEHSGLQEDEILVEVSEDSPLKPAHVKAISAAFGPAWLDLRIEPGASTRMRLKTHVELSEYFNKPGEFLLIPAQEITSSNSVHTNVLNVREPISGGEGTKEELLQAHLDAVAEQSERLGVPMVAHVNHLNWSSGVTAEQMIGVRGLKFFEIYNGHPGVHTWGRVEAGMPSNDEHWDIIQSMRLQRDPNATLLRGLATDDSHNYHEWGSDQVNPGRGWIMVRSESLDAAALVEALHAGDFYSTTGVTLRDIQHDDSSLTVSIEAEEGVTYTTLFLGTRKGFDPITTPRTDEEGNEISGSTRNYTPEIGIVLRDTTDNPARYEFKGDELYVRAIIISSKPQSNPALAGDPEVAWVQPVRVK